MILWTDSQKDHNVSKLHNSTLFHLHPNKIEYTDPGNREETIGASQIHPQTKLPQLRLDKFPVPAPGTSAPPTGSPQDEEEPRRNRGTGKTARSTQAAPAIL